MELEALNVPKRIPQRKLTIIQNDIPGLLQDGFSVAGTGEHTVADMGVGQIVKGAFFVELLTLDSLFHIGNNLLISQIRDIIGDNVGRIKLGK
jgi:hypothetical protein